MTELEMFNYFYNQAKEIIEELEKIKNCSH